jgi:hypothetical protein
MVRESGRKISVPHSKALHVLRDTRVFKFKYKMHSDINIDLIQAL